MTIRQGAYSTYAQSMLSDVGYTRWIVEALLNDDMYALKKGGRYLRMHADNITSLPLNVPRDLQREC